MGRQTNRRTDKWLGRQEDIDEPTDGQTDGWTGREANRLTKRWTDGQAD